MEVRHAPAAALEPYLEHDGTINDDELGLGEGGYLAGLAEAGVWPTDDDPILLGVWSEADGERASVRDGNHRLILCLEDDPDAPVPYLVSRGDDDPGCHPGFPYDGALG